MQPSLDSSMVLLQAPTQSWQQASGDMGEGVEGIYHSDLRVVSAYSISVNGLPLTHVSTREVTAGTAVIQSSVYVGESAAEQLFIERVRKVSATRFAEKITIRGAVSTDVQLTLKLRRDNATMAQIRQGVGALPGYGPKEKTELKAPGASRIGLRNIDDRAQQMHAEAEVQWDIHARSLGRGPVDISWHLGLEPANGVVDAPRRKAGWEDPAKYNRVKNTDAQLWVERATSDLAALRLETNLAPKQTFLGAGAPWYLTLFGRDALISARMMLPLGTDLAKSTLRVLAAMQGTKSDPLAGEQPGKIMHELRSTELVVKEAGLALPPLYYGTVDATPLWIILLVDSWRAGLPKKAVAELVPNLLAALGWMRDCAGTDGFLSYQDLAGTGLANQGWKDSPMAIQWQDGTQAVGPVALCEVQGYAFEAAMGAADLLESVGSPGATVWRRWAVALRKRFRSHFWISSEEGNYPAIALDGNKRAVDVVASNMGHLLGTGILNSKEEGLVARRLISPELNSGFGLRTMSSQAAGYDPLSYHCGSIWAHDTAMSISGLNKAGFRAEGALLAEGLLAAAKAFGYRMPELYSGAPRSNSGPIPYPAACKPQAWSAAAAFVVAEAIGNKSQLA